MDWSVIEQFFGKHLLYVELAAVLLGAIIVDFLQRRLFNRLFKKLKRSERSWDAATIKAIKAPLSLIIWLTFISYFLRFLNSRFELPYAEAISVTTSLLFILAVTWFFLRLATNLEKSFLKKLELEHAQKEGIHHVDSTTALALGKIVRVLIVVAGFLVVLPTLGYSISGILAFGGAGALIISLAAQNLLSNFFGGLMIYLDRPFAIGDWIRSPDQEIEGSVEHIGWRVTRIRTFDKRPLYVPNAVFTKVSVENPQRMWNRRIKELIGIRYCDSSRMNTIVQKIKDYLRNHEEIDLTKVLIVAFNEFGPSSLNILVYTFTKTTEWVRFHDIKQEILLGINKIIEDEGAEIAFPTRTLHIAEAPPELLLGSNQGVSS